MTSTCQRLINGKPEEFLLFVLNSNMTLEESGMLKSGAKIQ